MKHKLDSYNMLTFKLTKQALSICLLSLMALPIHATEITAATEAQEVAADTQEAAMSAAVKALTPAPIPANVKAAVDKKLLSKIEINPAEVGPAVKQVFRAPIFIVEPVLRHIAVVDGEVLDLNYHGSAAILTGYLKLIRDDFVLDSVAQAQLLGQAFEYEFPFKHDEAFKQAVKFDKGWILFRGQFFDNHTGLVFTTDENGKITLVEYVLKINPEDYSYIAPTDITL